MHSNDLPSKGVIMALKKATRKRVKLKLAVSSPSGGGKTLSSLLMAYGLVKRIHPDWNDEQIWDAIAVIDTENESASQYASCEKAGQYIGEFNTDVIGPPFTSEKYIHAINECIENKIEVCIVDSLTHLWDGEGGSKDKQASIAKRSGNGFTSWREPKKEFRNVIDKILQTDMHFIVTMRSKTDYVQEPGNNGKYTIRKVGLAPIIAEGTDYEFTTVFDLDADHVAGVSKDRTGLFDGTYHKITSETGMKFADYIMSAPAPVNEPVKLEPIPSESNTENNPETGTVDIDSLKAEITSVFGGYRDKVEDKDEKDLLTQKLYSVVAEHNEGKKNWLKTNDAQKLIAILNALKEFEV